MDEMSRSIETRGNEREALFTDKYLTYLSALILSIRSSVDLLSTYLLFPLFASINLPPPNKCTIVLILGWSYGFQTSHSPYLSLSRLGLLGGLQFPLDQTSNARWQPK